MNNRLMRLEVENFRSLRRVSLPLGPVNVLVGPNGAGKSNVLAVFDFLADIIRTDLEPALDVRGGFEQVAFWGDKPPTSIKIRLTAQWTANSSGTAPDEYELRISRRLGTASLSRAESFAFKRRQGRGRRITVSGNRALVTDTSGTAEATRGIGIQRLSSGLSTLPRLSDEQGGAEVAAFADRLASFRVYDVRVDLARRPSRFPRHREPLDVDASNLAAFLLSLQQNDPGLWAQLEQDAVSVLPQLLGIAFEYTAGASREVLIVLRERGLRRGVQLADASYGTVRLLGLLALLHDPAPPALTCVEEIDHGLHPQALELLVDRVREASDRTQFIIATHSPALADRLTPDELVVCERRPDGSSALPAISTERVREIVQTSEDRPLGELWFSGALGGDLR